MGGVEPVDLLARIDAKTGGHLGAELRAQMQGPQHGAGDSSFRICVAAAKRQLAEANLRTPPPNTTLASSVPVRGQPISHAAMKALGGNLAGIDFACNYPGHKQTPGHWLAAPDNAHPTVDLFFRPCELADRVLAVMMERAGLGEPHAAEMQRAGAGRAELLQIGAIVNPMRPLFNGAMFDLTSAAHVGANENNKVRPPHLALRAFRAEFGARCAVPPPAARLAGSLGGVWSTSSDCVRADTSRLQARVGGALQAARR
jgi:hypothetical protein